MSNIQNLIDNIKDMSISGIKRKITGKNALVKDLFEFLFKRTDLKYHLLVLCTEKGLILNCLSPDLNQDLSGYSISFDVFNSHEEELVFNDSLEGFTLISAVSENYIPLVNQLQTNLKMLLTTFDVNKGREQYLLN